MKANQKKGTELQEKNLLGQLWFKYFPYWPLFLSFLILSCAGAWYKLRNTLPLYQATASITGELSTPFLYSFLLDQDGVHGPFTTVMPYQFSSPEYQSINAMSPDGNTYVRSDGNHGLYIFDFDRCSGAFENLRVLPFPAGDFFGFATVFAPDSKNLYLSCRTPASRRLARPPARTAGCPGS